MSFLTEAELVRMTGYQRPSGQRRWLERNGIPHYVNAHGKPVVKDDLKTEPRRPKLRRVES